MVIPAAVSATADYLNGGCVNVTSTSHYAWGDHEHYMVTARIRTMAINNTPPKESTEVGWGHVATAKVKGRHGGYWYWDSTNNGNGRF